MLIKEPLNKRISGQKILDNISFSLQPGDRVLLLGHNGAGKSTLLKILAGLMDYDSGKFQSGKVTYQGHELGLYDELSIAENISLFLKLCSNSKSLSEILNAWDLMSDAEKLINRVSQGLKFRTALACSFLKDFDLALLDEPTTALDEKAFANLSEHIKSDSNKSYIIASHDFLRLSYLVNRVIILDKGALVHDEVVNESTSINVSEYINNIYLKFRK
ncbi:MAG: ATP-binding cassette domain-containing protein [Bdellovibrionales bacterium]|nr:ATP-binding cassette domain-containing protein [Bdellovibrionales bacterium]